MAKIIDGKALAEEIIKDVKIKVTKLKNKPGLAAVLVGNDQASKTYIKIKEKACLKAGIDFHSYFLDDDCTDKQVIEVIEFLNNDPLVNGILVQLPLPKNFNTDKIIKAIDPKKDIDGFHPKTKFTSPNVLGIIELLKSTGANLKNKKITILANSEIFTKPFKKLLPECKITYLSPQAPSSKLKAQSQSSDILIVAVGKPKFIKPDQIKKNAILIDVGINKIKNKIVGDIDPKCDKIATYRSPVPGGVGPMTVAMLLKNTIKNTEGAIN